jgi:hypothetical protein
MTSIYLIVYSWTAFARMNYHRILHEPEEKVLSLDRTRSDLLRHSDSPSQKRGHTIMVTMLIRLCACYQGAGKEDAISQNKLVYIRRDPWTRRTRTPKLTESLRRMHAFADTCLSRPQRNNLCYAMFTAPRHNAYECKRRPSVSVRCTAAVPHSHPGAK